MSGRFSIATRVALAWLFLATPAYGQILDGSINLVPNGLVYAVAIQPDGKILIGGDFTTLGDGANPRNKIARLNADGSVDPGFNPGADGAVNAIVVQPDGKILVAGAFSALGGGGSGTTPRSRIGRLSADGTLDSTFNQGANGIIYSMALQTDGKILVGGPFTGLGGTNGSTPRNYIGRLNADGSLDAGFNPGADNHVYSLLVQPDGKIVVGGLFSKLGGGGTGTTTRLRIGRLNNDGTLDVSFELGVSPGPGTVGNVSALALQPDGKIIIAGLFAGLSGGNGFFQRNNIGRISPDGTIDTTFNPGADSIVNTLALQKDGRVIVGGFFNALGGASRRFIGRVNTDGSADASYDPGANAPVFALALQGDGSLIVTGSFSFLGDGAMWFRPVIGRLLNNIQESTSVNVFNGGRLIRFFISRGGPAVSRVTFEASADGITYIPLGTGTFFADSWNLEGATLPFGQNVSVRARAHYGTGQYGGSGSILERTTIVTVRVAPRVDFDGDGKSEIGVYRPSTGQWFVLRSSTDFTGGALYQWGGSGDIPVPADYDDDGRPDIAVYRPSTGQWFVLRSSTTYTGGAIYQWGGDASDIPVPGDYDGDGRPDIAIYRKSTGQWFVLRSSTNYTGGALYLWGGDASDSPVVGDYDGDGRADITVYRRSTGQWFVLRSSTNFTGGALYTWGGAAGDVPVPGDYDGDAITDIAVYRPAQGNWYILRSSTNFTGGALYQWGESTDRPVPADYDGDGKTDIAIFRPAQGNWYVLRSSTTFTGGAVYQWGGATDIPAVNQIAAQCASVPGSCGP